MYKVSWDEENQVMRGYIVGYHQHIPAQAITISKAQFAEYSLQPENYRVIGGVLTYIEPAELTHEQKQIAKWEEVKAASENDLNSGFWFRGYLLQSSLESRTAINNTGIAAQAALDFEQDFYREWTTADNSTIELKTTQDALEMAATSNVEASAIHAKRQQLRKEIFAATTEEELDAIEWNYTKTYRGPDDKLDSFDIPEEDQTPEEEENPTDGTDPGDENPDEPEEAATESRKGGDSTKD